MATYNGWSNHETWRAQVEIVDGIDPSDWWNENSASVRELTERLADSLKDYTEELLLGAVGSPFVERLVFDFLERVDWDEIAAHLVEDYADQLPARLRADSEAAD